MTTCEVCGKACPDGDVFCGTCGHELGRAPAQHLRAPEEPTVVNVRVVNSCWDSCMGCVSWAVGAVVIIVFVAWIISC